MLTIDEYEWLWQMYWLAGVGFVLSVLLLSAPFKLWSIRWVLVAIASVMVFSAVSVNDLGNKAPALLVWGLDIFLNSDVRNETAPITLARNAILALIFLATLFAARYFTKSK